MGAIALLVLRLGLADGRLDLGKMGLEKINLNKEQKPESNIEQLFRKLYAECLMGRTTEAIVLWKSATETAARKTLTA